MGDINKDDLYNMFKSYENNVKYNIQLYDRQEILVKEQTTMISSISTLTEKLSDIHRELESISKTISDNNNFNKNKDDEIHGSVKDVNESVKGVGIQLTDLKIGSIKDHGSLKTGLIVITIGLSSVIITLIVALEKIWSKSDIIDAVAKFIGIQQ